MFDGIVIVVIRYQSKIRWFKGERELWILDLVKLRDAFIENGYQVPELDDSDRFGLHTLDENNVETFLDKIQGNEISCSELSKRLASRFPSARSWWDVADLFPSMFIDFDAKSVAAFYHEGVQMEKYIPQHWNGEFIDFANEYPENIFPDDDKFWVKGDSDLLKVLNERARKQ
ncbi:group-specific protein [Pseudoalteromonas sp. XMcav11-Q]|uniref:group-specific protein n=1 Tax=Pseudoalteromonas sp. XMcav11-Q TaxID=3136665 RepID=UPI0032C42D0B